MRGILLDIKRMIWQNAYRDIDLSRYTEYLSENNYKYLDLFDIFIQFGYYRGN